LASIGLAQEEGGVGQIGLGSVQEREAQVWFLDQQHGKHKLYFSCLLGLSLALAPVDFVELVEVWVAVVWFVVVGSVEVAIVVVGHFVDFD